METEHSIKIFYNRNQSVTKGISKSGSRSPEKPKLLLNYLEQKDLLRHFEINSDFLPFSVEDFLIAHTDEYVDAVFNGKFPLCASNALPWSKELAASLRWTNASLYNAIRNSIQNPEQISFSPTSGFHHAMPKGGSGFCTFSGQVIASVKIFRELGKRGAYLDLDGHFGNSIEDSRDFVKDFNEAIPIGFNINPEGHHGRYMKDLQFSLGKLGNAIYRGEIDYIVWCHGADSHEDDDLGSKCTTAEWIECSRLFYSWLKEVNGELKKPIPVSLSLFGGYRSDDYNSVLSLHTADLVMCLNTLCGRQINYVPEMMPRKGKRC